MKSLDILLLAAGKSRRFGSDKRIKTLPIVLNQLQHAFNHVEEWRILLVLSKDDRAFLDNLPKIKTKNIEPQYCESAQQGMGTSLAFGATFLNADIAMICLADMPSISYNTYRHMYDTASYNKISVPFYNGIQGHPVVFGREFYSDLTKLSGNSGAKIILQKNAGFVEKITSADMGILLDIDTNDDWEKFRTHS